MRQPSLHGRPVWFDAAVVAAALWLLFVATATYSSGQINDPASALTSAWAVGQHGTLDMSVSPATNAWYVEVDGHLFSDRMPGIITWAIPFYALLGQPDAPTTYPAGVAASTATALAMAAMFCLFSRIVDRRTAGWATAILALTTSTWTVSAHALWPHGMDQLWLTIVMLAAGSRRWWLAGLASAAAIVTRPTMAIVSAVVGLAASIRDRSLRPALIVGLLAASGGVALLLYNTLVFGRTAIFVGSYDKFTGAFSGGYEHADATSPLFVLQNIAGALVSPARGLLVISPALILLIPGLPAAWRSADGWVKDAAVGGLTLGLLQLLTNHFAGGSGFYGYRYTLETLTLCAPLLLLSWRSWTALRPTRRRTFLVLCAFGLLSHLASILAPARVDATFDAAWTHYLFLDVLYTTSRVDQALLGVVSLLMGVLGVLLGRRRRTTRQDRTDAEVRLLERAVPAP